MAAATRPARDDSIHTSLWTKCRVQEEGNDKVQVPAIGQGIGYDAVTERPAQKTGNQRSLTTLRIRFLCTKECQTTYMAIVKRLVDRGLAKSPTMKSKEIKEDVEQVPEQKGGHGRSLDDQDWVPG